MRAEHSRTRRRWSGRTQRIEAGPPAPVFNKEELRARVADKLVAMEEMFDPRCKLTFVMRAPHLPDGDMIVTADNIDAVIVALQRLRGYEEIRSPLASAPPADTETPNAIS